MKALHRLLPAALALAATVSLAAPADAEAGTHVVVDVPGPTVWIPGHWTVHLGKRVWVEGYFDRSPGPDRVWVPGHYEGRGRSRHWVPGHYERR